MNSDLSIAIGAIVTIVAGFGVIAKLMLNQASNDRTADRDERLKLAAAVELMAENSGKQVTATEKVASEAVLSRKVQEKGFNEAKQRNGHLAEQTTKVAELVVQTTEKTIEAVQTIGKQTITEQKIEHQTINTHEEKK